MSNAGSSSSGVIPRLILAAILALVAGVLAGGMMAVGAFSFLLAVIPEDWSRNSRGDVYIYGAILSGVLGSLLGAVGGAAAGWLLGRRLALAPADQADA